ncbi:polysaccharide deacetylase family protein [Parabacteroides sp. AD58]|uniref:Polysaccharide deacetylase family protein n=1 Tax=Parabacteroides absconsus TaxID=2951805 RepID=A0ABZ2INI5_9BACT|nr:polysaccharide deacetylase family protein [Parabacteroides sp. AD58]MCM6902817.1 polysaccharide deacetylase family protein [Parabacteroides sp. AD58]
MNQTIYYIIRFLLGVDRAGAYSSLIGYTSDVRLFHKYKVVIVPSGFFQSSVYGTPESLPQLPLKEIEGVPLLFGTPKEECFEETWVIYADIIASSYFLLSRYEEIQKRDIRDKHGRFPGKESLPYKAGFIHRPIVEEYGRLLRHWLRKACVRIPEPQPELQKIWLTHDVDAPFFCRSLRNICRETLKGIGFREALKLYQGPLEKDPYYTFPWMLEQDSLVKNRFGDRCHILFFLKAGGRHANDKPHYQVRSHDIQKLLHLFKKNKALLGLHSSYEAGIYPDLIPEEKMRLEHDWKLENIHLNRHHYLASREPEDLTKLIKAGITDDFTMGYADVSGFRLGTCRPVKWINPMTRQLTSLTLHPLSVMDCTLSESQYMGLSPDEAYQYCAGLVREIRQHRGEIVWLWHNTSFAGTESDYHKKLYVRLLNLLKR